MKKIGPYVVGLAILILVLLILNPRVVQVVFSYILNSKKTEQKVSTTATTKQTFSPSVTFKTVTDSDSGGKWTFSATYPVFDSTLGQKFNAINSQIEAEIQVIKLQTTSSLSEDTSPENVPPKLTPFGITITSSATTSAKFGTVSVIYSTFVDGGLLAHPYTNFESHTFNLNDGTEKKLNNFFSATDFLNKLSSASVLGLKKYFSSMGNSDTSFLDNNEGLTASSTNFSVFMLSNDDLILQFAEYQIGSRPYGAPRIEIPYSNLNTN